MRTRVSRHMLKIMVDMRCGAWFQLRGFLAAYTPILHLLTFPLSSPPALSPSMTFPPVCDCNFPARFCTIARGTLIQKRHHRFVRATFFHDIPSFPRLLCRHHFTAYPIKLLHLYTLAWLVFRACSRLAYIRLRFFPSICFCTLRSDGGADSRF